MIQILYPFIFIIIMSLLVFWEDIFIHLFDMGMM